VAEDGPPDDVVLEAARYQTRSAVDTVAIIAMAFAQYADSCDPVARAGLVIRCAQGTNVLPTS
jgi:hypothetical protein